MTVNAQLLQHIFHHIVMSIKSYHMTQLTLLIGEDRFHDKHFEVGHIVEEHQELDEWDRD